MKKYLFLTALFLPVLASPNLAQAAPPFTIPLPVQVGGTGTTTGNISNLTVTSQGTTQSLSAWFTSITGGAIYVPSSVAITGGTINGATIGATTPSTATFTAINLPSSVVEGSGSYSSGSPFIYQNATITGSTSNGTANVGEYLNQNLNANLSGAGVGGAGVSGFAENLNLNGSSNVNGPYLGGFFQVNLSNSTGNASGTSLVGLTGKCNMYVTDGNGSQGSCYGYNTVSYVGPGVTASQDIGGEVDFGDNSSSVVTDKIGLQIVDLSPGGSQGTKDDVALSLNNQYTAGSVYGLTFTGGTGATGTPTITFTGGGCTTEPTATVTASGGVVTNVVLATAGAGCTSVPTGTFSSGSATVTVKLNYGLKYGLGFGRYYGQFPVATNGTVIYGTGFNGSTWTVANGIDWHLGTATGNWLNLGGVFTVSGAGNVTAHGFSTPYSHVSTNITLSIGLSYDVDTSAARSLALPALSGLTPGQSITVQDASGLSQTNPITITANGSDTFLNVTGPILFEGNFRHITFIVGLSSSSWEVAY